MSSILYWRGDFTDVRTGATSMHGKVFWDKATPGALCAELRGPQLVSGLWSDIVPDFHYEGLGAGVRVLRAKTIRAAKRRGSVLTAEVRL